MTLRTTNHTPRQAYPLAKTQLAQLKGFCTTEGPRFNAQRSMDQVSSMFHRLRQFRDVLAKISAVDGIDDYAKTSAEENDLAYNFKVELDGVISAVEAVMIETKSIIPVNGNGTLLEKRWQGDEFVFSQTKVGETTILKTLLSNVVVLID